VVGGRTTAHDVRRRRAALALDAADQQLPDADESDELPDNAAEADGEGAEAVLATGESLRVERVGQTMAW
jgi:hypothetical protein